MVLFRGEGLLRQGRASSKGMTRNNWVWGEPDFGQRVVFRFNTEHDGEKWWCRFKKNDRGGLGNINPSRREPGSVGCF